MTSTEITIDQHRAPAVGLLTRAGASIRAVLIALAAFATATPGPIARHRQRCRDDELGAISVEQFAWIGIALFLIVAAAAALKIYWGDVSTFVTSSWDGITGQGAS